MNRIATSGAAMLLASTSFVAADGHNAGDWTGFYAGIQAETIVNNNVSDNQPNTTRTIDRLSFTGENFGVTAGYRYDLGDWVVGGEIDYMLRNSSFESFGTTYQANTQTVRAGAEVGRDFGNLLVSGSLGLSYFDSELTVATNGSSVSGRGYYFGVGADYQLSNDLILGVEVLATEYTDVEENGNRYFRSPIGGGNLNDFDTIDAVSLGMSIAYRF